MMDGPVRDMLAGNELLLSLSRECLGAGLCRWPWRDHQGLLQWGCKCEHCPHVPPSWLCPQPRRFGQGEGMAERVTRGSFVTLMPPIAPLPDPSADLGFCKHQKSSHVPPFGPAEKR